MLPLFRHLRQVVNNKKKETRHCEIHPIAPTCLGYPLRIRRTTRRIATTNNKCNQNNHYHTLLLLLLNQLFWFVARATLLHEPLACPYEASRRNISQQHVTFVSWTIKWENKSAGHPMKNASIVFIKIACWTGSCEIHSVQCVDEIISPRRRLRIMKSNQQMRMQVVMETSRRRNVHVSSIYTRIRKKQFSRRS